jgi:hypothetical protein
MTPEIADVSDVDRYIIARLPLDVEGVVDAVRQLVRAVICGEGEQVSSVLNVRYARRYLLISAGLPLGAVPGVGPHGFDNVYPPQASGVQGKTNDGEKDIGSR